MSRAELQAPERVVAECMAMVGQAETAFRSRWRMSTLERVDKELHDLLVEQIDLYSTELISGTASDLRDQSAAMVRGWSAAVRCMEGSGDPDDADEQKGIDSIDTLSVPHDAYLIGLDWASKTRVVISDHKQSIQHLPPIDGVRTLAVSAEEVAKLFGGLGIVSLTKATFPDAELIEIQAGDEAA